MKHRYKAAVIGTGARGTKYSIALSNIEEVELVSVCDIDTARLKKAKENFGYAHGFIDYKESLTQDNLDFAVICTPAYFHPEMSIFAMQKGLHVLCEKPMALSLAQAEKMETTAEQTNRQLALGFQYHNTFPYKKLKYVFKEDMLGHPAVTHFIDVREIRSVVGKLDMHNARYGNGGPIVDMACHYIDQLRSYYACDPVQVTAKVFAYAQDRPELAAVETKAPETANIMIEYANGDMGIIMICWGLPPSVGGHGGMFAIGPKGRVEIVERENVVCTTENQKREIIFDSKNKSASELIGDPQEIVARSLLKSIEGGGPPQRGAKDGHIALATSLAALKSSKEGRTVRLEEIYQEKPSVVDFV